MSYKNMEYSSGTDYRMWYYYGVKLSLGKNAYVYVSDNSSRATTSKFKKYKNDSGYENNNIDLWSYKWYSDSVKVYAGPPQQNYTYEIELSVRSTYGGTIKDIRLGMSYYVKDDYNRHKVYFPTKGIAIFIFNGKNDFGVDINEVTIFAKKTIDNICYKLNFDENYWSVVSREAKQENCVIKDSVEYNGKYYPVKIIETQVFKGDTVLKDLHIPPTLNRIEKDAFTGCKNLKNVYVKDLKSWLSICWVDDYGKFKLGLRNNSPLRENGGKLYVNGKELKDLVLNGETIGEYSFSGCSNLASVTFAGICKFSDGDRAFYGCKNLRKVKVTTKDKIPITYSILFGDADIYKKCALYVPKDIMKFYTSATGWKEFAKIAAIDGPMLCDFEVDDIYYNIIDLNNRTCEVTFDNANGPSYLQEEITVPKTVQYKGREFKVVGISDKAFNKSPNLSRLTLPNSIEKIGKDVFEGCPCLKMLQIPNTISVIETDLSSLKVDTVTFLGNGTAVPNWFKTNKTLKVVSFNCPKLTNVADSAFYSCIAIEKVLLPKTIERIGVSAYAGCNNLKSCTLPEGLNKIEVASFKGCKNLPVVSFGASLKEIPFQAFADCGSLRSIDFGKSVKMIGDSAFVNCSTLENVSVPKNIEEIGNSAFYGCTAVKSVVIDDSHIPLSLGFNPNSAGMFSSCQLKDVYVGRNLDGKAPFNKNTTIESVTIGHMVTIFPDKSLATLQGLKKLSIGNRLTEIPSFVACTNLEELTIGSHVKYLYSFNKCQNLKKIKVYSAKPYQTEADFSNKVYIDCELSVPKGSVKNYQKQSVWKNFFDLKEYNSAHKATGIQFAQEQMTAYVGDTYTLDPLVIPADANEVFVWKSSNEKVAKVNAFGEVKIVGLGEASISATTTDGTNLVAKCAVTAKNPLLVTSISTEKNSYKVTVGKETKIIVSVQPAEATNKTLTWKSADPVIATVSQTGVVHANKVGRCVVTVKSSDGSNIEKNCNIDVLPVFVTKLTFKNNVSTVKEGEKTNMSVSYEPADATITDVVWKTSNGLIAKIDETGTLVACSPGKVTITATAKDGSSVFVEKEIEVLPFFKSNISALFNTSTGLIDLRWKVVDYVKNVKDYNVYVSENGGPYYLWMPNTTKTYASFRGKAGHSYRFYVTARDNDGHVERYTETGVVAINR